VRYESLLHRVQSLKMQKTEEWEVVKGTSRRIIVVKSPDPRVFEEAIFVVREDYMKASSGLTQAKLLSDARRAANGYVGLTAKRRVPLIQRRPKIVMALSAIFGSALGIAACFLVGLF